MVFDRFLEISISIIIFLSLKRKKLLAMTYEGGKKHMLNLCNSLEKGEKNHFFVGKLRIDYPGFKKKGDYRLSYNNKAPTHNQIVERIYEMTTKENFEELCMALEDIYNHGLTSKNLFFSTQQKQLLFWITLQEEINYPQPQFAGRKLSYQRFFEGALAKLSHIDLNEVKKRANNHDKSIPKLLEIELEFIPCFYR